MWFERVCFGGPSVELMVEVIGLLLNTNVDVVGEVGSVWELGPPRLDFTIVRCKV